MNRPVDVRPELERPMLVLELRSLEGDESPLRVLSFSRHTLGLGRSYPGLVFGADVRVGGGDSEVLWNHFEVFERDGRLQLRAFGPTLVDGEQSLDPQEVRKLTKRQKRNLRRLGQLPPPGEKNPWLPLKVGSVIEILSRTGSSVVVMTVTVTHFTPILPFEFSTVEEPFLKAITDDPSSIADRLVYADALEEANYLIRADYLRLQLRLLLDEALDGDADAQNRYLKNLVPGQAWVNQVGQPSVRDSCPVMLGRACPVQWGVTTAKASACAKCDHVVRYPSAPSV